MEKVFAVQCETEFNQTKKVNTTSLSVSKKGGMADALSTMQAAAKEISIVNIGDFSNTEHSQSKQREILETNKAIIAEKGKHKEWGQREAALVAMQEIFESVTVSILKEEEEFITECFNILKMCLEENNI
jgi:PDZ domain-containing secreted protein